MATSWFVYDDTGGVCDPLNYTIISGNPICPAPKRRLCAIFAEIQMIGGVQKPYIPPALCSEIHLAISTLIESSNVRLKP
ncbi:hypothetical protein SAMN05421820_103226 [Pedobacter steynii]|uniref:Uncharacterized protein n=1 Tax=Pedobacter steynii TaxID=430522 RepID=A0A1G9RF80_9SPHI|nr:hypothetical protein SAMN05421820_103226 [Pedobacter steynii]